MVSMRASEIETGKGLQRRLTVAVPSAQVNSLIDSRLQETARTVNLNGFRKGKVPVKVVRERFGGKVRSEVLEQLMLQGWQDAVSKRDLKPAGPPVVEIREAHEQTAEFQFHIAFEVYPEVKLPDFDSLKVECLKADVKESDINEMVEILRQQQQAQPEQRQEKQQQQAQQQQGLPEENDDFYRSFGIEDGRKVFRREVAANMARELKRATRQVLQRRLEEALVKAADFPLPEALVQQEIKILRTLVVSSRGGDVSDAKVMEAARKALPDSSLDKLARRKVCLQLILAEVIRQQNIKANPDKVRETIVDAAATYESPDEVIAWHYANKEALARVEAQAVEEAAFDYIVDKTKVKTRKVPYRKLIETARAPLEAKQ